jgi:hypothetical protein
VFGPRLGNKAVWSVLIRSGIQLYLAVFVRDLTISDGFYTSLKPGFESNLKISENCPY